MRSIIAAVIAAIAFPTFAESPACEEQYNVAGNMCLASFERALGRKLDGSLKPTEKQKQQNTFSLAVCQAMATQTKRICENGNGMLVSAKSTCSTIIDDFRGLMNDACTGINSAQVRAKVDKLMPLVPWEERKNICYIAYQKALDVVSDGCEGR